MADRPDRVAVFLDYQNIQGTARRCFHPRTAPSHAGQFDPITLARLLVSRRIRDSELIDVRVYRSRAGNRPRRPPTTGRHIAGPPSRWSR